MRRCAFLVLVLPLAGCFIFPKGKPSVVEKVPEEMKRPRLVPPAVMDRHLFGDVTRLRVGSWATYREGNRAFTIAAVANDPEGLWVEVIEEGEPRQASARRVTPEGVVKKAFYREISKEGKSTVEPQALQQWAPPAVPARSESRREEKEDIFRVGATDLKVRSVRAIFEDLDGRRGEERTLWSAEVPPVYAGSDAGGLVRKETKDGTVELVAFGSDARPLVDLPKP